MPDFSRLDEIRIRRPLVHCVSNIVSANDCANLALAVGASPMMAHAAEEMEDITAISSATVLNTGTPDAERFKVCLACGRAANAAAQPLVLDPVGVGASPWRLAEIRRLLDEVRPDLLRVNLGEALALCHEAGREQGVDSTLVAGRDQRIAAAGALAKLTGASVLLTGEEDVVHDGARVWLVQGGSALSGRVTGTGCMLSVLCGAFAAVEPDFAEAACLASAFWKLCAERAERASAGRGPGSFRTALFDAAYTIDCAQFAARENILEL